MINLTLLSIADLKALMDFFDDVIQYEYNSATDYEVVKKSKQLVKGEFERRIIDIKF